MTVMNSTKVKLTRLLSILDVGQWDKMWRWKTVILMTLTLYRSRLMCVIPGARGIELM